MHVGGETYGVEVDRVHTVILPQPVTAVPRTADHILGVINLRGRVVPILDLRARFGLSTPSEKPYAEKRIVMVDVGGEPVGMVVDGVSEVLRLSEASFASPPETALVEGGYVRAVARAPIHENAGRRASGGERLILMLDVDGAVRDRLEGDGC